MQHRRQAGDRTRKRFEEEGQHGPKTGPRNPGAQSHAVRTAFGHVSGGHRLHDCGPDITITTPACQPEHVVAEHWHETALRHTVSWLRPGVPLYVTAGHFWHPSVGLEPAVCPGSQRQADAAVLFACELEKAGHCVQLKLCQDPLLKLPAWHPTHPLAPLDAVPGLHDCTHADSPPLPAREKS
eukprot:617559-Rhodomonas_salina.1